ncbi:uncharacterized protein At1g65710-like [Lycium barbarum]|uniref:uncharacterized protein At1g65710-like n=1 Tax=Lycium barbarum TaxID=112863 RepID=UPI00293EA29D|nr:uncharacterized protein At1g65710-like [Lycium barbarum]
MGSCLSKKSTCSSSLALANTNQETEPNTLVVEKKKVEGHIVRREIFVIKHRISHEESNKEENDNFKKANESIQPLRRATSCTKEEVDAILIQCGRVSRSSSRKNGFGESSENTNTSTRNYSISKRSYDFDNENRSDIGSRRVSRSPVRRSESPTTIQRIQVKRNVGVASPRARSRSPAKMNSKATNENMNSQQQPLFLSRSNSRKRENSPFRRKPGSEIDTPVDTGPIPLYTQKLNAENINNSKVLQGTEEKLGISKAAIDYGLTNVYGKVKEQQKQQLAQEVKTLRTVSEFESLMPEGITRRSRSPSLSRDLDINDLRVESNPPTQSYTELLLEDIQNFHQKSSSNSSFSLPPCVTKACSILEAVADFNSSTSSNPSSAFSEDRRRNPTVERLNKKTAASLGTNPPSIQKYATFGRGTDGDVYKEELESSESNSFVGYQRCSFSPSSREPNSADSTDSWAPSKSYSRLYMNPLAFQKCTVSDHAPDMDEGKEE